MVMAGLISYTEITTTMPTDPEITVTNTVTDTTAIELVLTSILPADVTQQIQVTMPEEA